MRKIHWRKVKIKLYLRKINFIWTFKDKLHLEI